MPRRSKEKTEQQKLAAEARALCETLGKAGRERAASVLQDPALCGAEVSPDQYARAVAAACDVELNKSDDCGDGDQSLLHHRGPQDATAQALKNVWGAGGDFLAALAQDRLSVCMKAAALGETKTVEEEIAKAKAKGAEAMFKLLERRETLVRFTPLDGAIMGAIQWGTKHGGQHAKVAQLLLAANARPNAKDVCGFTPLARCVTCTANDVTLEIGMLLIEHGADGNEKNRFGHMPLLDVVNSNRADCAMLLCEGGADPMIASHFTPSLVPFNNRLLETASWMEISEIFGHAIGRKSVTGSWHLSGQHVTLHGLSRHDLNGKQGVCGRLEPAKMRYAVTLEGEDDAMLIRPRNLRVKKTSLQGERVVLKKLSNAAMNGRQGVAGAFHEARGRWAVILDGETESIAVKPENLEVVAASCTCAYCGVTAPKMSKCSKCFKTTFCSPACREAGFSAHKALCLKFRDGQVTVNPHTCGPPMLDNSNTKCVFFTNPNSRQMGETDDKQRTRYTTTVVKVQTPAQRSDDLLVYNEKRDINFFISPLKCDKHGAIFQSVSDHGVSGRKAYFPARVSPDGAITIDYLDHLPPTNW